MKRTAVSAVVFLLVAGQARSQTSKTKRTKIRERADAGPFQSSKNACKAAEPEELPAQPMSTL